MPNALGEIGKGIAELGICGAYYCKTIRPKSTNKPWLFHCFFAGFEGHQSFKKNKEHVPWHFIVVVSVAVFVFVVSVAVFVAVCVFVVSVAVVVVVVVFVFDIYDE